MAGLNSFLSGLLGGLGDLTGGQGVGGVAQKAKTAWDGQSNLTKGAIAGGLLAVLMSGNARRLVGTGVEVGGAALIGGLALQAFSNWQAGKTAQAAPVQPGLPIALPMANGTAFLPSDPAAAENLATKMLQAMVAATKADGVVTAQERAAIDAQLANLGFGPEAQAMIATELAAPLDPDRIAALASSPEEAAGLYTASLLVVNRNGAAEKGYLALLAARLNLDAGLVAHLEASVGRVV